MECSCTVEVDIDCGDDEWKHGSGKEVIALKLHSCSECHSLMDIGDWYFRESYISSYSGVEIYKTCEHCYSLRQVFFSSGWYYGMLWEGMSDFVSDCGGELSIPCILELTKVARDKVLDLIEEGWEYEED